MNAKETSTFALHNHAGSTFVGRPVVNYKARETIHFDFFVRYFFKQKALSIVFLTDLTMELLRTMFQGLFLTNH